MDCLQLFEKTLPRNGTLDNARVKIYHAYCLGRSLNRNTCYAWVGAHLAERKAADATTIRLWGLLSSARIAHADAVLPDGVVISDEPPANYAKAGYELVQTVTLGALKQWAIDNAEVLAQSHPVAESTRRINEGLIQVPPPLMADVLRLIASQLFWMMRDRAEMKDYPEHRRAVVAEAKRWGAILPRARFKLPASGAMVEMLPLDFSTLPASYRKLEPVATRLAVVIDCRTPERGAGTIASFSMRTLANGSKQPLLRVHLLVIRGVADFPKRRQPEEMPFILNQLQDVVEHELRHMVQFVLFAAKDKRQVAKLPGYHEHGTDYYASAVERDPQIGSAVHDFVEHWNLLLGYGSRMVNTLNLAKSLKQFVGASPPAFANGFSICPVFKALKKSDPEAYRRAVSKFLTAAMARLVPASSSASGRRADRPPAGNAALPAR